ncbi:zf-HC2 domain-containing protein [Rhodococcus marinonascens]|uniref:zf-HC2 domain-containing protein n=1 Tax=Rhodococcus marinonascens TaxID=38311 RepID=UPI000933ACCD|nr:zf-HC2 domain-containing protein [Rhodococcus marinonascens]
MTIDDFESHEDDPYASWDAAYVLGALSPGDRREYEGHLARCRRCSLAVAELAGMPGLLAQISPEVALGALSENQADEHEEPPAPHVLTRLVGTVVRRRRYQRAAAALAAAAAVVAVAVPVGVLVTQTRTPGTSVSATGVLPDGATGVLPDGANTTEAVFTPLVPTKITANASVASMSWGTVILVRCSYAEALLGDTGYAGAEDYALTVTDHSGVVTKLATWTGDAGQTVRPTGTTSLPVESIASIDVRSVADNQVLLTTAL